MRIPKTLAFALRIATLAGTVLTGAVLASGTAGAVPLPVTVPSGVLLGGIPARSGTGLTASYYRLAAPAANLAAAALAAAAMPAPTATFIASTVCFPTCGATMQDGTSITSYVQTNGTHLSGTPLLGASYTSFAGELLISRAGTYNFSLYADDGASLSIGNVTVISMPNTQSWAGASRSATFAVAGLYPILISQFDIGGYTGITLIQGYSAIPSSALYAGTAVPEPGTLGVCVVGLIGLAACRLRRSPSAA